VDPNFYCFRSAWRLPAPVDDVYRALECLEDYAAWWPEVKEVRPIDDEASWLRVRSLLPYDLEFVTRRRIQDPVGRVLEADLDGDLGGFSKWTITADPGDDTTVAVFDEEVAVNKALLRRLAYVARPAFRANHALMMHNGRRGLTTYVAGWRRGREDH
jgi:hypothetical protein